MASGDTLLIWTVLSNEYCNTAPIYDLRNYHPVLDFDDSHTDIAVFRGILPQNYSGNGLRVYIHWAATSAVVGNCKWVTQFERIGDQVLDIDADSWGDIISGASPCPGTCGHVDVVARTHDEGTEMDDLAAGEQFRLRVWRDGANPLDTMVGDAELLIVELREQ